VKYRDKKMYKITPVWEIPGLIIIIIIVIIIIIIIIF